MLCRNICRLIILISLMIPSIASARDMPPFVSTDWLNQNLAAPALRIIDIRSSADYQKGHIPNAAHASLNTWAVNREDLLRELPAEKDLVDLLGSLGITEASKIVVAGKGSSDFDRADAIRVAWTMRVAGIQNVSVLDGGFQKWLNERRPATVDRPSFQPGEYKGRVDASRLASKNYVLRKIGKSILIDNRSPELFFGITTEPWALKPGHIKGARSLPTPWIFQPDGLLRSQSELESMAHGVVGRDKGKEIIAYCGVGAYASVWSYILTELLGYRNVKVYDGSLQEWILDPAGPVEIHRWN